MGWTFTHREKGTSNKDWFANQFEGNGFEILDVASGSMNRNNVYIAMRLPDGNVTAVACLTRWVPKEHFNYGWKDMSEEMGPHITDCPRRIMDLLSPVDDLFPVGSSSREWAQAWRDKVDAFREKMDNKPKLRDGMMVCTPYDLPFGGWTLEAETPFMVENAKRKIFAYGHTRFYLRKDTMIDLQDLTKTEPIPA